MCRGVDAPGARACARVQVALRSRADQRLLVSTLTDAGLSVEPLAESDEPGGAADLTIVDPGNLHRWRRTLQALRAREHPVVFPVLVLAGKQELSAEWLQHALGDDVDDLLQLPTSAAALQARVRNLLRLRSLSRTQAEEHRLTRQTLDGVSRALHTLHACNEIMLREATEDGLLASVCNIITESEGFALAWVGFADQADDGGSRIAKHHVAGPAAEYARVVDVHADDSPEGRGPAGLAIATGRTRIVADMAAEPSMAPWREPIARWGLGAVIALPLKAHRGPAGVLVVYSVHAGDFGDEERMLLERLADNLAFGIDRLRMQREKEEQSEEIRRLAYRDTLTGLPNRRSLLERLEHVVAHAGREQIAAVLFVDLNDFKLINDALGHAAGDEVLQSTARRIRHTLRAGDLVARQGGDEFIVVMIDDPRYPPPEDEDARARLVRGARAMAERIIETLRQPFDVRGYAHHLNASIGISLLPFLGDEPETVIDQADMAMYHAKHSEQRIAFYSTTIGSHRQERLSLEAKLHQALDSGEFHLGYQPIWELQSGRIVAVEALLRWQDDSGNTISPGTFIPVAEEIGLLGPIGEWVIAEAARQLEAWRRAGLELSMGVNLSVSQLQGAAAAGAIRDQVVASGSDPRWWVLELTEEAVMQSPDEVLEALHCLDAAGFRLALDDFGRGYSSLARLQTMPLHTLKVDKLFVDGLSGNEVGGRVVRAVVELARQLSLRVVAEGIESPDQHGQLAAMDCDYGQGFLVSAALPGDRIPGLVRQGLFAANRDSTDSFNKGEMQDE